MKGLATLIRLHKRSLDELRRQMVLLENEKAQLQQAIIIMQRELEAEMSIAGDNPEMGGFFGEFAKRIKNKQDTIKQEIAKVDEKIIKLNDEIASAFAELKKFEIALENARARATAENKRRETIMLDEIAAQQHQKKKPNW